MGKTCYGHNGDGRWVCRFAVRSETGYGKSERTCRQSAQRALLCLYHGHLVALHGFIKKTLTAPDDHLALARKRQKELQE